MKYIKLFEDFEEDDVPLKDGTELFKRIGKFLGIKDNDDALEVILHFASQFMQKDKESLTIKNISNEDLIKYMPGHAYSDQEDPNVLEYNQFGASIDLEPFIQIPVKLTYVSRMKKAKPKYLRIDDYVVGYTDLTSHLYVGLTHPTKKFEKAFIIR